MSKTEHSPSKYKGFREKYVERVEYLIDDKKTYGVSQNEMAKELGASGGTITGWKSGTFASGEMLIAMSQYFDVRIDWLLGLDDNDKSPRKRDLIALTGLSDAAVKNLIEIKKRKIPFAEEMLSEVLASPNFVDLILAFFMITNLCDVVDSETKKERLWVNEDHLKLLKYGRYDIAEKCMMIMRSIRPIDRIISDGEKHIQSMTQKQAEEKGW